MKTHLTPTIKAHLLRGFTLIELLVVIAIIAVLAAILFPVAGKIMERSRSAKCLQKLRSIGSGLFSYAAEHNGELPSLVGSYGAIVNYTLAATIETDDGKIKDTGYVKDLLPYVSNRKVFICPSTPPPAQTSPPTAQTCYPLRLASFAWAGTQNRKLRMLDMAFPSKQGIARESIDYHKTIHQTQEGAVINMLFADGHVSSFHFYKDYNKTSHAPDANWFNSAERSDRRGPTWHWNPTTSWDTEVDPGYWTEP